jgi:hypothetical protein
MCHVDLPLHTNSCMTVEFKLLPQGTTYTFVGGAAQVQMRKQSVTEFCEQSMWATDESPHKEPLFSPLPSNEHIYFCFSSVK